MPRTDGPGSLAWRRCSPSAPPRSPSLIGKRGGIPFSATVLIDGENVRRSTWPNLSRNELVERASRWAAAHDHEATVVWEGTLSADDAIAERVRRSVRDVPPPVWVVTSDRELRARVADYTERVIGGGSFVRELDAYRP